ncbi:MAG: GNAT family protein [Bacteroidota bacterium]
MELQTQRTILRELQAADLHDIHDLHSFPEVDRYNTLGIPAAIEHTQSLLSEWLASQVSTPRKSYIFTVRTTDADEFVGLIALNIGKPNYRIAEVWYKMHPSHWRRGYASEALAQLLKFGFETLNMHRIEAGCAVDNKASIRVLEKAGMTREGRKRAILPIRGEWVDNFFYSILEDEFTASAPGQSSQP